MDDLIVPAQLAGLHVEREQRRGVEVVAFARGAAEHRHGVAGVDVDEPEIDIDRRRVPHAGAALLPDLSVLRVARRRPRLVSRFARTGNRGELPQQLAGLGVERHDLAAKRPVAVGEAGEEHAAGVHRRAGNGLAGLRRRVADLRGPDQLAGALLDRGDVAVHQADKHHPVTERDARRIRDAEAGVQQIADVGGLETLGRLFGGTPDPLAFAGLRIERVESRAGRHEHHAVFDDRRGPRRGVAIELHRPRAAQRLDVLRS